MPPQGHLPSPCPLQVGATFQGVTPCHTCTCLSMDSEDPTVWCEEKACNTTCLQVRLGWGPGEPCHQILGPREGLQLSLRRGFFFPKGGSEAGGWGTGPWVGGGPVGCRDPFLEGRTGGGAGSGAKAKGDPAAGQGPASQREGGAKEAGPGPRVGGERGAGGGM